MLGQQRGYLCKGCVVREVEAQTRVVQKDEVANQAQLERVFAIDDADDDLTQLFQDILHRRVLDRVQFERLARCIQCVHDLPAERLDRGFTLNDVQVVHALVDSCGRMALITALRTIAFSSFAAFSSAARDAGVPTLPSAIAAHARSSADCFRNKLLPFSSLSSMFTLSAFATAPNASKNAIFSVRSVSRTILPWSTCSRRARAG